MKNINTIKILVVAAILFIAALIPGIAGAQNQTAKPVQDSTLYKEIRHMDSVLFNALNEKKIEVFAEIFDEDLEFYHDKGGLSFYAQNISNTKAMFERNTDLKRELVKGSLEVYPINGYGAIQVGAHRFCHTENGKPDCGVFKFVHVWQKKGDKWKLTRVISYDH